MAAYVVTPSRENWPIIQDFLAQCEEGAIVISPDMADRLLREESLDVRGCAADRELVEYEFGGAPDVWVDRAYHFDHTALDAVRNHLKTQQP